MLSSIEETIEEDIEYMNNLEKELMLIQEALEEFKARGKIPFRRKQRPATMFNPPKSDMDINESNPLIIVTNEVGTDEEAVLAGKSIPLTLKCEAMIAPMNGSQGDLMGSKSSLKPKELDKKKSQNDTQSKYSSGDLLGIPLSNSENNLIPLNARGLMLNPLGLPYAVWTSLYCLSMIALLFALPMVIFLDGFYPFLPIMSITICSLCVLDVVVISFTGIKLETHIEMDYKFVQKKLWKSGIYWTYLLGGFPFGVFVYYLADSQSKYLRLLGLLHLIPILVHFFGQRQGIIERNISKWVSYYQVNFTVLVGIKIISTMIIYWHFNSCIVNYFQDIGVLVDLHDNRDSASQYVFDLFNAASHTLSKG